MERFDSQIESAFSADRDVFVDVPAEVIHSLRDHRRPNPHKAALENVPCQTQFQPHPPIVPYNPQLVLHNPSSMAPAPMAPVPEPAQANPPGPHPSFIQVAKPYMFQQQVNSKLMTIGTNPTREDQFRLQGVTWINDVRIALQLPVRTFCTAATYFHRFRLVHKDTEYQYQDAAAAALLTACKIEDTLKKSKEIICAAHNLKHSAAEHLSSDDNIFEGPSKAVIGLERLMLEASSFDFRVRYPQKHLIKLVKKGGIQRDVAQVAYQVMLDLYRTFAPLKQTCSTMSFACVELATLIYEKQKGWRGPSYKKWWTSRSEIMETMLDLLDLYTHYQKQSIVGPLHNIEKFISIRIKINQELEEKKLPRNTEFYELPRNNGMRHAPNTPVTPASPTDLRFNGHVASPANMSPKSVSSGGNKPTGIRGQNGTVRFMLDANTAKDEMEMANEYFRDEFEDYEVEIEETVHVEPIPTHQGLREPHHARHHGHGHGHGRDYRQFNHNHKRMRR
ncbi:hypothetical protein SBOR_6263 [Sclerotinia borealis F-4128]|uniref:RNA polymerase II holoenzyme cyclin-like subunit n=1 Tax=Sclerotinia borealis (strain F-4128) TaxID=1432307 RepID=W9CBW1_SCLBF|nr:hypothetical protein SBOR_6263 [Sclerotinia borealis F-4128]